MEPAIALCACIAAVSLTVGALGAAAPVAQRLSAVRIPMPVRSVAAMVMMVSLFAVMSRPRPAKASVDPPIVRLADTPGPESDDGVLELHRGNEISGRRSMSIGQQQVVSGSTYVVRPGDCLWRIARALLTERNGSTPSSVEIARLWPAIYVANRAVIGDDPNLIFPGQHLEIPEG
ncbi:MAG: LysM peptidoglycan-binding domain-containing protein [Actinomycetota bacterium]